jgi:PAS domain S-box-containing protein
MPLYLLLLLLSKKRLCLKLRHGVKYSREPQGEDMEGEERFRAIFEHAAAGVAVVGLDGRWLELNERVCEITGYSRLELLATDFQQITHPDDLHRDVDALGKLSSGELNRYSTEKRYIHKDGRTIWIKLASSLVRDVGNHAPLYIVSVIDDITEYKHAQELLLKAEEKRSKAFRQSPLAVIITSAKDHRYIEVNESFERLTGYSRGEVIGRTPFDIAVWVDPSQRTELVQAVVNGKHIHDAECRFRTKDGRIITGLGFAELIEIDGESCVIAAALDITERKRMEEDLRELSGRLIAAQDEERKRIATELNEAVGQAMSVLTIELGQLARSAHGEVARGLQVLSSKAQDLTTEISILSQTLHPSTLEYAGLPWAIEGLCRQFTHLYGLQVSFKHEGLPACVPPDVGLCIYRIVQEGLQNVVLHSGTRQAWIDLGVEGQTLRLALWDKGSGFDVSSAKRGMGLTTMRERCRRLEAEVTIQSHDGTRIEVRVPLSDQS